MNGSKALIDRDFLAAGWELSTRMLIHKALSDRSCWIGYTDVLRIYVFACLFFEKPVSAFSRHALKGTDTLYANKPDASAPGLST